MGAGSRIRRRLVAVVAVVVAVAVAVIVAGLSATGSGGPGPSAPTPPPPAAPARLPPVAWLGLDYNANATPAAVADFSSRGIVFDREGATEVAAGQTPANSPAFAAGLDTAFGAGMIPDVQVDAIQGPRGCTTNPTTSDLCLPSTPAQIDAFVAGFVQTASSALGAHPGRPALFEPTDEPWRWASPPGSPPDRRAASQYAAILARLLPAARVAGVPLADIYVPAVGRLDDGTWWVSDLYAAQPCLAPGPATCGPISGWNLHPYGLPGRTSEGIGSVPVLRERMQSGADNIVVSEIGFCAGDVNGGKDCLANQPDITGTSAQTALWLSETLSEAAPMHRAGWLSAVIVWDRGGDGWAMQYADGRLTPQGRALDLFAASPAAR
jgi:hypothetical protein